MKNNEQVLVLRDGEPVLLSPGIVRSLSTGRGKVTEESVLTVYLLTGETTEVPLVDAGRLERKFHDFHFRESRDPAWGMIWSDLLGRRILVANELEKPVFIYSNAYEGCVEEAQHHPIFKAVVDGGEQWSEDIFELVRRLEPDSSVARQLRSRGHNSGIKYYRREYDGKWIPQKINYDVIYGYQKAG